MCAIFGVINHPDATWLTFRGLHALQHRGQEGCGILTGGPKPTIFRDLGLVGEKFSINDLPKSNFAIGQTRYSTVGGTNKENLQPFFGYNTSGWNGLVHNGQLLNDKDLRQKLMNQGKTFVSESDSECLFHLLTKSGTVWERLAPAMGAFSLIWLTEKTMTVVRDPHGYRPLVLGTIDDGYVIASETTALDAVNADFVREVKPGEAIIFPTDGSLHRYENAPIIPGKRFCSFEWIYFSRPDSNVGGREMYDARRSLGKILAQTCPVSADIVVPVPDSGVPGGIGFSNESGIPFEMGLVRSHYSGGRTFILPTAELRSEAVEKKLRVIKSVVDGKRVVLVDDSIVRGTTSGRVVRMLRRAGAKEVHFRVTSPPVVSQCFYGIDLPDRNSFVTSQGVERVAEIIGADSVGYLPLDAMVDQLGHVCTSCFTGEYPDKINTPKDS